MSGKIAVYAFMYWCGFDNSARGARAIAVIVRGKTFVDIAGTSRIISRRLARIPGQHSGLHNLSRLLCSMHTELFDMQKLFVVTQHSSIRTQTNRYTYQASRPYTIQLPALLPRPCINSARSHLTTAKESWTGSFHH